VVTSRNNTKAACIGSHRVHVPWILAKHKFLLMKRKEWEEEKLTFRPIQKKDLNEVKALNV
jgi:hypothetical protein